VLGLGNPAKKDDGVSLWMAVPILSIFFSGQRGLRDKKKTMMTTIKGKPCFGRRIAREYASISL